MRRPLHFPVWPIPLYRQFLLLAWCAGIFASRFFPPGCTALAVILLFWLWRCYAGRDKAPFPATANPLLPALLPSTLLLAAAFIVGVLYTNWRTPEKETDPIWLQEAAAPQYQLPVAERGPLYKDGLRLIATVDEVSGLTDRRLRLILSNVRPLASSSDTPLHEPLAGRLAFTWQNPVTSEAGRLDDPPEGFGYGFFRPPAGRGDSAPQLPSRPAPGQVVELTLKPRLVRSLSNPGLWETETYWAAQSVWHQAWAQSDAPDLRVASGYEAHPGGVIHVASRHMSQWREDLRRKVTLALPGRDVFNAAGHTVARRIEPGASLIPALLFDDKYLMNSADAELFSRSTLSHSLALSGMHLSYVAALGYGFARLLFWLFPGLAMHVPRRKFAVAAAILPALCYTWLGGAPPSLVRSMLMLIFWGLLLFFKKPTALLDGLLWAVGLILLLNPLAIFDLRLQLSALAVAAIGLSMPLLLELCSRITGRLTQNKNSFIFRCMARLLSGSVFVLGTSFVAQLALMPLLVHSFGIYGLAFPLNLLWLPVLGALVMPAAFAGLAASAFGLESLAALLFQLASKPCSLLLDFLYRLDQAGGMPVALPTRPHWLFFVGYWLLLIMAPVLISRFLTRRGQAKEEAAAHLTPESQPPRSGAAQQGIPAWRFYLTPLSFVGLGLLLCLTPLGIRHYETAQKVVRLRLLDVGQGQAALLEWPGGGRLLLDGGGGNSPRFNIGKEIVAATLLDNRPARLDYMLASHPDQDHIQGLLFPLEHLEVGFFADNGREPAPGKNNSYLTLLEILERKNIRHGSLHAGHTLELARDLRLEIIHPPPESSAKKFSDNNASLVARLIWKERPLALLCGDAEVTAQRFMLQNLPADALRAQVLVLPHHGSAGASLDDFYDAVEPELALAGCRYANQWGFPSRKVRESLAARKIELLDTAEHGQIIVEWDEKLRMSVRKTRRE